MNHSKLILLLTILVAFGCYNTLDVNLSDFDKQIVINSLLTPDSNVLVNVSYTKAINDAKDYYINDAKVELSWSDSIIELTNIGNGFYTADIKPKMNREYNIRIKKNDTILTAKTFVPDTPNIQNIQVEIGTGNDASYATEFNNLNISIKDMSPDTNYYEIFSPREFYGDGGDYIDNNEFNTFAQSNDPILLAEGYIDGSSQTRILFSDKDFNNSTATLHLKINSGSGTSIHFDTITRMTEFYLVIRSVSEEYYKFMKSYQAYQDNITYGYMSFNSFANMSFISKTVGVYSNIENGNGIFAAYSEISRHIYFEDITLQTGKK